MIAVGMCAHDRGNAGITNRRQDRGNVVVVRRARIDHRDIRTVAHDIGLRAGVGKRGRIAREHAAHQRFDGFGKAGRKISRQFHSA